MLADNEMMATVAVKNLDESKKFYGEVLGLEFKHDFPGGALFQGKGTQLFIYESGTAGSGEATCLNWRIDDIESEVQELKAKGVSFEVYDIPDATQEGDVSVMGHMKAAWFKDPNGNILGLSSGEL